MCDPKHQINNIFSLAQVIHRDLKPSNILIDKSSNAAIVGDFSSSRVVPPNNSYPEREKDLTKVVVTQPYRGPEVVITAGRYSHSTDVWSVGCIVAEMITGEILFKGADDWNQISVIVSILGTNAMAPMLLLTDVQKSNDVLDFLLDLPRTEKQLWHNIIVGQEENVYQFLEALLKFVPSERVSAADALRLSYFAEINPQLPDVVNVEVPLTINPPLTPKMTEEEWKSRILQEGSSFNRD